MDPAPKAELLKRHCLRPGLVDPVGIPTLIRRDDLVALVPLWVKKTEEIRNDPRRSELIGGGWLAETWGYTLAAAEIGLKHTLRPLANVQTDHQADLPFIHYCYDSSDAGRKWVWDKRTYRPWERVPDPPDEVPLTSKALISLLNEWVAMQEHRICLH